MLLLPPSKSVEESEDDDMSKFDGLPAFKPVSQVDSTEAMNEDAGSVAATGASLHSAESLAETIEQGHETEQVCYGIRIDPKSYEVVAPKGVTSLLKEHEEGKVDPIDEDLCNGLQMVIAAVRMLARAYKELDQAESDFEGVEAELYERYCKVSERCMRKDMSKEEYTDVMDALEAEEKALNDDKSWFQRRGRHVLQSLSHKYDDAVALVMTGEPSASGKGNDTSGKANSEKLDSESAGVDNNVEMHLPSQT